MGESVCVRPDIFGVLGVSAQLPSPGPSDLEWSQRNSPSRAGLAMGSTAFSSTFDSSSASIKALHLPELAALNSAKDAVGFIPALRRLDLPDEVVDNVVEAYQKPFVVIWIIMASFAVVGLLSSFFLSELSLESEDLGKQRFEERARDHEKGVGSTTTR